MLSEFAIAQQQLKNIVTYPSTFNAALLSAQLKILVKGVIFLADNAAMHLLFSVSFFESSYFDLK